MTLFAPVDEAFSHLDDGALDRLLADKAKLQDTLAHHLIPELTRTDQLTLTDQSSLRTEQGGELMVRARSDEVLINNARILDADITCSNGIMHKIDSVLWVP